MPCRRRSKDHRLQTLPREARNIIWESTVVPEESVELCGFRTFHDEDKYHWTVKRYARQFTTYQLITLGDGGIQYGTHDEHYAKARGLCRYIKNEVEETFSNKTKFIITIPMDKYKALQGYHAVPLRELPTSLFKFTRVITVRIEVPVSYTTPSGNTCLSTLGVMVTVVVKLPTEKNEGKVDCIRSLIGQPTDLVSPRLMATPEHVKLQADYNNYVTSELHKSLPYVTRDGAWIQDVLSHLRGNSFIDCPHWKPQCKQELLSAMAEYYHRATTDASSGQDAIGQMDSAATIPE